VLSIQRPFITFAISDKSKQTELGDWCQSTGEWRFDETLTFAVCLSSPPVLKLQLCCRSSAELGFVSVTLPEKMLGEADVDLIAETSQHFACRAEPQAAEQESGELWETSRLKFPRSDGNPAASSPWEVELSFALRASGASSGGHPLAPCGNGNISGLGIGDIGAYVQGAAAQVPAWDEVQPSLTAAQETVADSFEEACEAVNKAVERFPRFQKAAARVAERRYYEVKDLISELMTPQEVTLDYGKPLSIGGADLAQEPSDQAGHSQPLPSPAMPRVQPPPPPQVAPEASPQKLPPGWKAIPMQHGRVFYHHHESGASRWDPPPHPS